MQAVSKSGAGCKQMGQGLGGGEGGSDMGGGRRSTGVVVMNEGGGQ